jgi:hypothetical protein
MFFNKNFSDIYIFSRKADFIKSTPGRLHLVGGQLVVVVDLHGAVDDARARDRLQVPDLQNDDLNKRGFL